LKDLVIGQAKINDNLTKKLTYNDKMIENINAMLETLCSSVKSHTSFNKMIETQIAQIAASVDPHATNTIIYITTPRIMINESYLSHAHMIKHDEIVKKILYYFPGYTNKIQLPNPDLALFLAGTHGGGNKKSRQHKQQGQHRQHNQHHPHS